MVDKKHNSQLAPLDSRPNKTGEEVQDVPNEFRSHSYFIIYGAILVIMVGLANVYNPSFDDKSSSSPQMEESFLEVKPMPVGMANVPVMKADDYINVVHKFTKLPKKYIVDFGDVQGHGFHTLAIFDHRFYVYSDGSFLMDATLIDKDGLIDVYSSLSDVRKKFYDRIVQEKKSDIPSVKQGTGALKFVILSNPDCVECRLLEQELDTKNYTTWTVLIENQKNPVSKQHIKNIMATGKPALALHDLMADGMIIPDMIGTSNYPFEEVKKSVSTLGIERMPSIIAPDGSLIPLISDKTRMLKMIKAHQ